MRAVGDCCIRKIRDGEGERKEKTKKECDGKRRIFYYSFVGSISQQFGEIYNLY